MIGRKDDELKLRETTIKTRKWVTRAENAHTVELDAPRLSLDEHQCVSKNQIQPIWGSKLEFDHLDHQRRHNQIEDRKLRYMSKLLEHALSSVCQNENEGKGEEQTHIVREEQLQLQHFRSLSNRQHAYFRHILQ